MQSLTVATCLYNMHPEERVPEQSLQTLHRLTTCLECHSNANQIRGPELNLL